MKKKFWIQLFLAALVISGTHFFASSAGAEGWTMVHGAAARLETPANTNSNSTMGWGLDFDQKHGLTNWVHIAIPSPPQTITPRTDKIKIVFSTGSSDATVYAIHVYNGPTKVYEIPVPAPLSGGMSAKTFSLGSTRYFPYGLNIAIGVRAGTSTTASHRFKFAGAGAYWLGSVP